uniref:F-box domain-containing protein n=1 Tax=Pithovirus LCPAC101 TaxID=2506586 RepID=A0A481Z2R0_9VIRU|nr:MAG: hypothetical protein LCPAC101_00480 [Pithovirus LCPAC101]
MEYLPDEITMEYLPDEITMEYLPDEITMTIISYLDDTYSIQYLNKRINDMYNSYKLYGFIIRNRYPHVHKILINMVDHEYAFDMWKYFYENIENNKKYTKYYTRGLRSKYILSDSYRYGLEFIIILLINDKTYIPTKEITNEILGISYRIQEDILKSILESYKFKKHIDMFNYCVLLAEHCIYKFSVYIASNYLNDEDFRNYKRKYINSISVNLMFGQTFEYTQSELYNEIRNTVEHFRVANIDHLINKISEKYICNKYCNGMIIENITHIIKYKYMIKNIVESDTYYIISKSEIISHKFYDQFSIEYTINYEIDDKMKNKIYNELSTHFIRKETQMEITQKDNILCVSTMIK